MPKSVNKAILIGNVGKDPEIKYTTSGIAVAKFAVATNQSVKDKNGEWQNRAEWHNVVAWERLAEIVGEYVHKGTKLYVEGKLQTSSWENRNGEKKYRTEIVARDLVLLNSRDAEHESDRTEAADAREPERSGVEITEEDIPF